MRDVGLSANEVSLYILLLDGSRLPATTIAKRMRVPRTTVYSLLNVLTDRGLVGVELRAGRKTYFAQPPSSLTNLVKKAQSELDKKSEIVSQIINLATPLFTASHSSMPRVQVYEGKEAIETMLYQNYDTMLETARLSDSTIWGFQDESFVENYRSWLEWSWSRNGQGDRICLLTRCNSNEKKLRGKVRGRVTREAPAEYNFLSSIWVHGHFVVFLMTRSEPHFVFTIKDPAFSDNLRLIFKLLWSFLPESKS